MESVGQIKDYEIRNCEGFQLIEEKMHLRNRIGGILDTLREWGDNPRNYSVVERDKLQNDMEKIGCDTAMQISMWRIRFSSLETDANIGIVPEHPQNKNDADTDTIAL